MKSEAGAIRRSHTVQVVDTMTDRQKAVLGITDAHLNVLDGLFDALQLLVNDADRRPLFERLGDIAMLLENFELIEESI